MVSWDMHIAKPDQFKGFHSRPEIIRLAGRVAETESGKVASWATAWGTRHPASTAIDHATKELYCPE